MYLNINGAGLLLELLALTGLLGLGRKIFMIRRRPGMVRVRNRRDARLRKPGEK